MPALRLDRSSREPLHSQLYRQLAELLRDGEIDREARLPSTRAMAKLLGLSRNTVIMAYDALVADDLIRAKRGSGMRVNGEREVTGMRAIGLRRVIREARYPSRTISFTDPDGNSMYLNY